MKSCLTILGVLIYNFCFAQVEKSTEPLKAKIKEPVRLVFVQKNTSDTLSKVRIGPCGGVSSKPTTPLVVVDGKIVPYTFLETVNPNNIATIEILKDLSALERFGRQTDYGVIIITMKCKEHVIPAV